MARRKAFAKRGTRVLVNFQGAQVPGTVAQVWRNWVDEETGKAADIFSVNFDASQRIPGGMATGTAVGAEDLTLIPDESPASA